VLRRLYYQLFRKAYGASHGTMEIEDLQRQVDSVNEELRARPTTDPYHTSQERFLAIDADGDDVIVTICSPLMKRVHRYIQHSAEIVFMDAGGNMDRHNMRVFLLMTFCAAGGLPLGVLITTNEQSATITRALQLYNTLLDHSLFYGRGLTGLDHRCS